MQIGQKYETKRESNYFTDCEIIKIKLIDTTYYVEVIDKKGHNTFDIDLFFQLYKPVE